MGVYEDIIYTVEDPVATITLNRPETLNAWTTRMRAEVRDAIGQAENDRRVVAVVITGAGRGFCSGADMTLLSEVVSDDRAPTEDVPEEPLPDDFAGEFTYLLATQKPVIAAINGPIAGMAVPLVLCCDIRFMAEEAKLITAFAHLGLIAEFGIGWLLPHLVGTGHALDLLFSSRPLTGTEAERIGLVQKALPRDELLPHALAYVRDLAEKSSPRSLAIIKRQVYTHVTAGLGPAEREAHELMIGTFASPEPSEGIRAFLEKRPPKFGRIGEG